jgi:hypothetical protein
MLVIRLHLKSIDTPEKFGYRVLQKVTIARAILCDNYRVTESQPSIILVHAT